MRRRCTGLLLLLGLPACALAQSLSIDSIINPSSCRQIVETFAADSFLGRLTASPSAEKAAKQIAAEFSQAGCIPGADSGSWFMPFPVLRGGKEMQARNVVAILPGKSQSTQWIIFSAHYDHLGTRSTNPTDFSIDHGQPERNDTIYNGANDNASGISALILLARYFANAGNNERTILFIAFSGEELGLFGSEHAARILNHDSIIAMINMDMLGVPLSRRNKNPFITGARFSNLQTIINQELYRHDAIRFGKNYFRADPFRSEELFRRSDNYPFALRGIPAHTFMATNPRHRFYHSLNDEPATLDYEVLAKNIQAIAIGSATLISGSETPWRINPFKITD
jgi:hypothetical protein